MRTFWATLLALTLLFGASPASAYGVARDYRHNQVASNATPGAGHGSGWQGFSPTWYASVWLRADNGVTTGVGPVTATGTTPPTVTLAGTPTSAQTTAATPYVELDCTTLGALGTSKFTVKVNGSVTATNVASAASGVVLTGSGLTAGWAVGASAVNDVYTANITASTMVEPASGNSFSQATPAQQPIFVASDSGYGSHGTITFSGAANQFLSGNVPTVSQPFAVFVVGQAGASSIQTFFSTNSGSGTQTLATSGNGGFYAGSSVIASSTAVTSPSVIAAWYNGASSRGYVNGSVTATTGSPGAGTIVSTALLGVSISTSNKLTGEIAEVLVVKGAFDPYVNARMIAYYGNYYGHAWQ